MTFPSWWNSLTLYRYQISSVTTHEQFVHLRPSISSSDRNRKCQIRATIAVAVVIKERRSSLRDYRRRACRKKVSSSKELPYVKSSTKCVDILNVHNWEGAGVKKPELPKLCKCCIWNPRPNPPFSAFLLLVDPTSWVMMPRPPKVVSSGAVSVPLAPQLGVWVKIPYFLNICFQSNSGIWNCFCHFVSIFVTKA